MRKIILGVSLLLVTIAGSAIGYNYMMQDELIFKAIALPRDHKFDFQSAFEEVFLPVGDGEIHGIHFKAKDRQGAVCFFHGQGKNLDYWGSRADFFLKENLDVFIIDYRGFGKSSRGFTEKWLLQDSLTAYDYLNQHFEEDKIIVCGNSLGTAMATWVAANRHPNKLILEAPYYSMLDAAAHRRPYFPMWLIRMVVKYPLHTNKWIKKVKSPVYIFHGRLDNIIPFVQGQLLYEEVAKHNDQVTFIPLDNFVHVNMQTDQQYQEYIRDILQIRRLKSQLLNDVSN